MWVTLQDKHINFNNIEHFYIEENNLIAVNLQHNMTIFFYPSKEKVKKVYNFLVEALRSVDVNYVIKEKLKQEESFVIK